jgi:hypothetical protein
VNRLNILKRVEALEAQANRLPEPPAEPDPEAQALFDAWENDPEVVAAREVIRRETGLDPFGANYVEYREINNAFLTNRAVGDARLTIHRRLWEVVAEHGIGSEGADNSQAPNHGRYPFTNR